MEGYAIAQCPAFQVVFGTIEVKADHPQTVLNPKEWFTPVYVAFDTGVRLEGTEHQRIFVRGADTCWFNLSNCEVRHAVSLQG